MGDGEAPAVLEVPRKSSAMKSSPMSPDGIRTCWKMTLKTHWDLHKPRQLLSTWGWDVPAPKIMSREQRLQRRGDGFPLCPRVPCFLGGLGVRPSGAALLGGCSGALVTSLLPSLPKRPGTGDANVAYGSPAHHGHQDKLDAIRGLTP